MSRFHDNLQMYWPHMIGLLLFIPSARHYILLAQWIEHAPSFAIALYGLASVMAPDEVSSWTGRYGWTYDSFWTYPPTYIRIFGFVLLGGVLLYGF